MDTFKPGDVILDKYKVTGILGQGGMGQVLAAHDDALDRAVAIKFLLPALRDRPDSVSRFEREARTAARIQNEHVARIYSVEKLDGVPFLVMEYLSGQNLATVLRERGHLPVPEAVDFLLQASEAVAEAHTLGIVHRDLKPANLFLTTTNGVSILKVLDFGISKTAATDDVSLTGHAAVLGSPVYMSPEQFEGGRALAQGVRRACGAGVREACEDGDQVSNRPHVGVPRPTMRALLALSCALAACAPAETSGEGPAPSHSPVASSEGSPDQPTVVRFDDVGMSYAIPAGWAVHADAEVMALIHRVAQPSVESELGAFLKSQSVVFLALGKRKYAAGEQLTVTVSITTATDRDKPPVAFLERQVRNRQKEFDAWSLLSAPAPITWSGVAGAEMTDRYTLRTHDGVVSTVRQTLRMFVRGDTGFLVTVMWNDARGARPAEATSMLEALAFYEPTLKR